MVVIDLHAELIRYDELLRSIKERFDDRLDLPPVDTDDTAAAAAVDREIADQLQAYEDDGRLTRNSSISSRSERSYDDAYEADEESILSCASSVVERRRGESSGPRTSLYGEEWRIAEDDENEIEDESPETRSEYEYEYEGSVVSDAETEHGDAGSVHTMTTRSTHAATASLPPSPITPNSFQDMDVHPFVYSHEHQQDRFHLAPGLMSEHHQHQQLPNPTADGRRHSLNVPGFAAHHNNSISSIDTHRTLGVLSAVMQMEARSILGSECNSSDNYRSYTSYCSDLYATHQTHLHNELSDLLDRSFVFDDQVLDIGVSESKGARAYNRQAQANADDGFPRRGSIMDMTGEPHGELTNEERERVMKPGRALGSHLRNRSVSEFGVRMRSVTAPAISTTPFPTPTNSETPCHQLPQHLPIMHSASAASLRPPQRTRVNARAPPPPEVGKYSDALGGATIYTFSQPTSIREESMTDSFHPMEQFADATSTWDSRRL